jgi:hypothetical protein
MPAFLICALAVVCTATLILILGRSAGQALMMAIAAIVWFVLTGVLAGVGFFSNFAAVPPRLILALATPAVALAVIFRGNSLRETLAATPVAALIYLQVFRVVVELLLFRAYKMGNLPVQMTFDGRNFDIVAGLTAPIAGWLYQRTRSRMVATLWNVAGLALLGNIVVVAILSMPGRLRYFTEGPANTLLTHFPFIYLPAVLVPIAYTAHLLSLRQLWSRGSSPEGQVGV